MGYISRIRDLQNKTSGYWAKRIISQLGYAVKISKVNKGTFDALLEKCVDLLEMKLEDSGAVTKALAITVENELAEMSEHAKKYTLLNVAHAHIDMNWMWDYSETVAITLGTFRTMLNLMEEYPEFTFSQSQASVYRIVEKHDPDMLEEIKARAKEGRWEVTASTWVEADKNMPNGESHARHILYTKRYLSKLLDLNPDTLLLDFEPDTFGHNKNVPEILSKGGVKYYYHCRGAEDQSIYKWKAPSGKSILVFEDPMWYNLKITDDAALYVPEFCEKYGMDSVMKVYGVGNHGGGPTRKDIERLIDMGTWPIYPKIKFSTYAEYFKKVEEIQDSLSVVEGELNFVFSGCYTTQARIKTANRIGENKLDEAETLSSLSNIFAGGRYPLNKYEKAWRKILFNQFHDILPGSGIVDTREYAMGEFQKVLAYSDTGMTKAMMNIAKRINTAGLELPVDNNTATRSEGAGVGFEMGDFNISHPERGAGSNRIATVFNPTQFDRKEPVELLVWDWEGDQNRLAVRNSKKESVQAQILEYNEENYWDHTYIRFLIMADVPAYGYATYFVFEAETEDFDVEWSRWPRLETPDTFILENKLVKVEFDDVSMGIKSFIIKETGEEIIDNTKNAGFYYIEEDPGKKMTAWCIGRYMSETFLNENALVKEISQNKNSLKQWISYEQEYKSSKLKIKVSLEKNSSDIKYEVECDWQEKAVVGKLIPQLNFRLPLSYEVEQYKYDVPFGTIKREPFRQDVPANSWMTGVNNKDYYSAMLITNNKYGFRGYDSTLSVTLLRSPYDPDPYPDNGVHKIKFTVSAVLEKSEKQLIKKGYIYNHPLSFISNTIHDGDFELDKSFIEVISTNAVVSSVKRAEDCDSAVVIRLYETEGKTGDVEIVFDKKPEKAKFTDINENHSKGYISIDDRKIKFKIEKYCVETVLVEF